MLPAQRRRDYDLFDRLFQSDEPLRVLFQGFPQTKENLDARIWNPPVDIKEEGDVYHIRVELPGVSQEDIDIEMTGDTLTVKGERKFEDEEKRENYLRVERYYGKFQRSFTLGVPVEAEKVAAIYRNGILELTVPKAEANKPKKVAVTTA